MSRLLTQRQPWQFRLFACIAMLWMVTASLGLADVKVLSAQEASERLASGEMILLDIRTPEEWEATGLAEGAWPVSMHTSDFPQQLRTILSKYRPDQIGMICATGGRSSHVIEILTNNGIPGIIDVSEGMFGNGTAEGWIARGLPVVSVEHAREQFESVLSAWE